MRPNKLTLRGEYPNGIRPTIGNHPSGETRAEDRVTIDANSEPLVFLNRIHPHGCSEIIS